MASTTQSTLLSQPRALGEEAREFLELEAEISDGEDEVDLGVVEVVQALDLGTELGDPVSGLEGVHGYPVDGYPHALPGLP
eukprot:CAMPEP_0118978252 /NCGR_PEP_ID=MMETSP1173-20130426/23235_1 /TAXON_ID=1034831 /ORGANISM="Rhizochromulina marina cf, Strain CCMP1243" /LENGTH=80 /DNA_ID=CAMNT_0006928437 /DNA_START=73 /DNA_END=311 /DNA_ORIENTATION=+